MVKIGLALPVSTNGSAEGQGLIIGPKELVTLLHKPNHKLFQLAFKANLATDPIAAITHALSRLQIDIVHATVRSPDGKAGVWNVFLDSKDYGVTEAAVLSKLAFNPSLVELEVGGGKELIVDEFFFPLVLSTLGTRVMLITQESFQSMLSAMDKLLGSGESVLALQEGIALGSRYAAGLKMLLRGDARQFISDLALLYSASGVGRCEFIETDLDHLRFLIRMHKNIECEGKNTGRPNSQWVRGHLAGGATTLFDVPMQCEERKCISKGDPYCEFELSKSEA